MDSRVLMELMIARRSHAMRLALAAMAVAVTTALRLLIGPQAGVPFITYFPAVLLSAAFLGLYYALGVLAACTLLAVWLFLPPIPSTALMWQQLLVILLFVTGSLTTVLVGSLLRSAVIELDRRAGEIEAFNTELQHRTNNALQLVQALARRASHSTDPAEFYETLGSRLDALAKGNQLLRYGALPSCDMHELVEACLAAFPEGQFRVSGQSCAIGKSAAVPVMMALHELCTNAAKYGALSTDQGHVELNWSADPGADALIRLSWKEVGGPPVSSPSRKGFGTRLLMPHKGLRSVELEFLPGGVQCHMTAEGSIAPPRPRSDRPSAAPTLRAGPSLS